MVQGPVFGDLCFVKPISWIYVSRKQRGLFALNIYPIKSINCYILKLKKKIPLKYILFSGDPQHSQSTLHPRHGDNFAYF